jgi:hypothetical protein
MAIRTAAFTGIVVALALIGSLVIANNTGLLRKAADWYFSGE